MIYVDFMWTGKKCNGASALASLTLLCTCPTTQHNGFVVHLSLGLSRLQHDLDDSDLTTLWDHLLF